MPILLQTLIPYTRARVAELHRRQDGVSEIVAVLLVIAAVIAIAGVVFTILRAKATASANSKNF